MFSLISSSTTEVKKQHIHPRKCVRACVLVCLHLCFNLFLIFYILPAYIIKAVKDGDQC